MRLFFLYPLLLTIVALVGFAEITAPLIEPHYVERTLPVHRTLYLERTIDNNEKYGILAAAIEWNEATNGQVVFDIQTLPQQHINMLDATIILNVSPDYPDIIILDGINQSSTLGYFNDDGGLPYIALIDVRIPNSYLTAVVLHELGHSLGLKHIKGVEGWGTLMCPSLNFGSNHITDTDLKQFCKIYHCDSSKFHGIPQIQ